MFNKMKLKSYLLMVFAVVIALAALITAVGVIGLVNIRNNTEVLTDEIMAAGTAVKNCRIETNVAARDLREMLLTDDPSEISKLKDNIDESLANIETQVNTFRQTHGTADGLAQKYESAFNSWFEIAARAISAVESGDTETARDIILNECSPALDELVSIAQEIDNTVTTEQAARENRLNNNLQVFIVVLVVVFAAALLVALLTAFKTTRQITSVVGKIQNAAEDLSEGKLSAHVDYQASNEFGQLSDKLNFSFQELSKYVSAIDYSMNEFASGNFTCTCPVTFVGDFASIQHSIENFQEKMRNTLSELGTSSAQVSAGADQVADGAQALAQGATEQARSVEELSAAISEISSRIADTAEFSQKANSLGQEARETVGRGKDEMTQLLGSIQDIASASNNIQSIIKVIDDIAFQTNILALNAAVEAARAGNAGKGFAVVADEVRSLAQKSADAAQETTGLIKNSLEHVSRGEEIAHRTDSAFNDVAIAAENILSMIEKIANASNEQAESISQISVGIDQISSVVQTNSATAEESAAASEELSGQAGIMKNLLDQFRLKAPNSSSTNTQETKESTSHTPAAAGYFSDKY